MAEAAKAQRPEILLITDDKTVLLEMGHDGKFSAKSAVWEENKVVPEGEELVIRVEGGPWFITKHPPAFRFSQGVLDEEDIEQAMAAAAVMDGLK
jgi:hypothetical protein